MSVKFEMYDIHNSNYMYSYVTTVVVFALFSTIWGIFAIQIKCQSLTLKMKVVVKEKKTGIEPFDWKWLIS